MRHKNVVRVSDVGVLVDGRGIREFTEDELSPDGNNQYVIMFMKEIRKIFPTIKFAGDVFNPRDGVTYAKNNLRPNKIHIYTDTDEWCWGWIAYEDYKVDSAGDCMYCVYSRKIENNKYDYSRIQHHIVMTSKLDIAVRNAKRYLSPFNFKEIVDYSKAGVVQGVEDHERAIRNTLFEAKKPFQEGPSIGGLPQLFTELFHLVDSEYKFLSEEFTNQLSTVRNAYEHYVEHDKNPASFYCVRIHERRGHQLFDVIPTKDLTANSWSNISRLDGDPTTCTEETLPTDIMGKLSVLSIAEIGEYIHDVGYRESEGIFYVTQ
tara:strand:- start:518 stop:1474 length:957 start_codon:yes stop_codon:yes gene_type:complete